MTTLLTLFSGIGGVEFGADQSGIVTPTQAVENDARKAQYHRLNHPHTDLMLGDIRTVPLDWYRPCDILWASPPCTEDSKSKNTGKRNADVAAIGTALIPILHHYADQHCLPSTVLIENVTEYQKNPTYAAIVICLLNLGYSIQVRTPDMADYGVPQNRTRMILQARLDGRFRWPNQTQHTSWYDAVADLLPACEVTVMPPWVASRWDASVPYPQLADNQFYRLPVMVDGQFRYTRATNGNRELTLRESDQPSTCIVASSSSRKLIAVDETHVIRATAQMNARWQSFPDHLILPEHYTHATPMVGNAVPPLYVAQLLKAIVLSPQIAQQPRRQAQNSLWDVA